MKRGLKMRCAVGKIELRRAAGNFWQILLVDLLFRGQAKLLFR